MNDIQIFNNPILGDLRTVIVNGKEYFFGVDIASMLMYKRPRKAVSDNCKGVLVEDSFKNNGGYAEPLIPEGDIYRLIIKAGQQGNSKEIKDKADKLEKWIFDEVLPSIRKTGTYMMPQTTDGKIALLAQGHTELKAEVDEKSRRIWKALRWTCRYFRWKPTALRKLSERKAFQSWAANSQAHTATVDCAKRFTTICMPI